jgi:hypothetical protein
MGDLGPGQARANTKVRELTVKDLRDLEVKFKGRNPRNPKVDALDIDDLKNIEEVFAEHKRAAAQRADAEGIPGPAPGQPDDWSVSCCCCTPCCCCAAAEVDPFAPVGVG